MSNGERFYAVVPAAGSGTRMGAALPKQYLRLADRTVLEWSLGTLLEAAWIERVVVVAAPGDARAAQLLEPMIGRFPQRLQVAPVGGGTRRDSVLAGLRQLADTAAAQDWVLVHDAARPGLTGNSLEALREALRDDPVGGLLALPVVDTVKRAGAGAAVGRAGAVAPAQRAGPAARVERTLSRDGLWLAQTPQMFRHGLLRNALERHAEVTDEAAAIEAEGHAPGLVEGERMNFKITTEQDLRFMQAALAHRERNP